jgi:hypothetical protein
MPYTAGHGGETGDSGSIATGLSVRHSAHWLS